MGRRQDRMPATVGISETVTLDGALGHQAVGPFDGAIGQGGYLGQGGAGDLASAQAFSRAARWARLHGLGRVASLICAGGTIAGSLTIALAFIALPAIARGPGSIEPTVVLAHWLTATVHGWPWSGYIALLYLWPFVPLFGLASLIDTRFGLWFGLTGCTLGTMFPISFRICAGLGVAPGPALFAATAGWGVLVLSRLGSTLWRIP